MDKSKIRYNKKLGAYQILTGNRWRRAEQRTCPSCGDKFYAVNDFSWGVTCGKRACILALRRKNRFGKLRESK